MLLRGPNGAGKTSCSACAPACSRSRGGGRGASGSTSSPTATRSARRVGLLGHRNGLYGDLTVAENVRFWGATVGATRDEIACGAGAAWGRRASRRRRRSAELSAGQKRRTALACLVARRAELWLLDEPHAGLDAAGRDELDAVLRQAVAAGATVVVASHELERAGALADRSSTSSAGRPTRSTDVQPSGDL